MGFIFSLSLLLTGCQKDDETNVEVVQKADYQITKVTKEHISKNREAFTALNKYSNSGKSSINSRVTYNSDLNFYIFQDEAIYIQDGEYDSYTFRIIRNLESNIIENLLISRQEDGTYRTYIVSYDLTEEEISLLQNNQYVDLTEKTTFTPIEYDASGIVSRDGAIHYNAELDYCYTLEHSQSSGTGWNTLVETQVDCPTDDPRDHFVGGGGAGSTDPNPDDDNDGGSSGDGTEGVDLGGGPGSGGGSSTGGNVTSPLLILPTSMLAYISFLNSLTPSEKAWYEDTTNNSISISRINQFLNEYNWSGEAKQFAKEAIQALSEGGEVDFEEKIINNLTGKALCIYNKMKEQNTVSNILNKFRGDSPKANINFRMDDLPDNTRAKTDWPDSNNLITITLNNDNSYKGVDFQPNVFVVNTIIHEIVHAEFLRQIIIGIGQGQISNMTESEAIGYLENGDYHIIYEYYRDTKDWSHNYMADYYRDTFARVTQEFDTGVAVPDDDEPEEFYLDVAWLGLMNFPGEPAINIAFDNLPNSEKNRIIGVLNNQLDINANQTCTQ